MCYTKCAGCIGQSLMWISSICIIANIFLFFPDWKTIYASEDHLSRYVWYFSGTVGGGVLMFLPAVVFMGVAQDHYCSCSDNKECGKSCAMLTSVLVALTGLAGSGYCVIVSLMYLVEGPKCKNSYGQWSYLFADTKARYLTDTSRWSQCIEPKNIVVWNITLFSILLGLGALEFILCFIQVINGLIGGICGCCCARPQQPQTRSDCPTSGSSCIPGPSGF